MPALKILEQTTHHSPHTPRVCYQIIFFINGNRRECGGASQRVTVVSKSTVKNVLLKVIGNLASHAYGPELHVRARQTFRHRYQIWFNPPVIDREPLAGTTKTGHHFVGNQKNAVLIAKLAQPLHITVRWNQDAVGPNNRLDNDRGDSLRSFELEHFFRAREYVFGCVAASLSSVI